MYPFIRLSSGVLRNLVASDDEDDREDDRIPRGSAMRVLRVASLHDPLIGLRAGLRLVAADFDIVEYAARREATVGKGLERLVGCFGILDDGLDVALVADGDRLAFQIRARNELEQPFSANEFVLAAIVGFCRRNAARYSFPVEVQLTRRSPSNSVEYESAFNTRVSFARDRDSVVFCSDVATESMIRPNERLARLFGRQATLLLDQLRGNLTYSGSVLRALRGSLSAPDVDMNTIAAAAGMSATTLRRRLTDEGTTFELLRETCRQTQALRLLRDTDVSVREVTSLLGYSEMSSFVRAFHRWTGMSSSQYRRSELDWPQE